MKLQFIILTMFIHRALTDELLKAARSFAAVIVTGPRRSGKTTLLRRVFPKASYHLLEDPDTVARLRADPRSFLEEVRLPVKPRRNPERAGDPQLRTRPYRPGAEKDRTVAADRLAGGAVDEGRH